VPVNAQENEKSTLPFNCSSVSGESLNIYYTAMTAPQNIYDSNYAEVRAEVFEVLASNITFGSSNGAIPFALMSGTTVDLWPW